MEPRAKIALLTTVHDPDGRMLSLTETYNGELKELFREIIAEVTDSTHSQLILALERLGTTMSIMPGRGMGPVRRGVLEMGLHSGCDHFHLCDFDRVLHWLKSYPEELRSVVKQVEDYDFLIMGRSTRALDTHPEIQATTERRANAAFSAEYGVEADITGAARGISRAAVELILRFSDAPDVGVDAEWPLIVQRFSQLKRGYVEVEGLEFETATFFEEEVREAGGLEQWKAKRSDSPREQRYRVECMEGIAAVARRFADRRGVGG